MAEKRRFPLSALLTPADGTPFGCWEGVTVSGLAIDSRAVAPGDLFFALRGRRHDGCRFIPEARARGAAAVVVPMDAGPVDGLPGLRAADPRLTLPAVARRFYGDPARRLRIAAVTGTNGKTTTAAMVAAIMAAAGERVGYLTTAEVFTGIRRFRPDHTTPEAHDLHAWFREMADAGIGYVAMEVSSHAVVLERTRGLSFRAGIVTNVTPDHLDFHGSFAAYAAAKRSFVERLGPEAVCILNADDPVVRGMAYAARVPVITYGLGDAVLQATAVEQGPEGTGFALQVRAHLPLLSGGALGPCSLPVRMPVVGRHNVHNALAAAAAALAEGVDPEAVRRGLASFRPPARRLETFRVGDRTVISDVAMNEGSCEAVLATVAALGFRRVTVVSAVRGNRGPEVNAAIARVLGRWNRRLGFAPLIVSLSRSHVLRYRPDYRVRPEELAAFVEAAAEEGLEVSVHEELPSAIAAGVERLAPGGVLLLLGTFGMDDGARLAARLLGTGGAAGWDDAGGDSTVL